MNAANIPNKKPARDDVDTQLVKAIMQAMTETQHVQSLRAFEILQTEIESERGNVDPETLKQAMDIIRLNEPSLFHKIIDFVEKEEAEFTGSSLYIALLGMLPR